MTHLNIKPGKIIGEILTFLLESVLDDKNLNNKKPFRNSSKLSLD